MPRIYLCLCLVLQILHLPLSTAFSSVDIPTLKQATTKILQVQRSLALRGGDADGTRVPDPSSSAMSQMPSLSAFFLAGAKLYSQSLEKNPILTKSVTACGIFAVSDLIAQRMEQNADKAKSHDKKRTITASLVGLLYFGPAAHFWYENIFRFFPGTSLMSTLQKAAMGQLLFGPSFTCIFFATSLLQSGNFTLGNWFRKIRSDFVGAWLAGVGFWPLVDLVSYSLIPMRWIPLFINVCSLIWNVYLSMVANRKAKGAVAP